MKFRLKEQIISRGLIKIVANQKSKIELGLFAMTRQNKKQLIDVQKEIVQNGVPSHLFIHKLPGKIGHGVFLHPNAKPIEKGQLVAPYAGLVSLVPQNAFDEADYAFDPVIDIKLSKEDQKLYDPKSSYRPNRLYALKLDAFKQGNFTRFVNHSSKPNLVAYLASTPSNPYQIIYFAKKQIMPGEQLLVSYEDGEKNYWGAMGITPFHMTPKTFRVDAKLKLYKISTN